MTVTRTLKRDHYGAGNDMDWGSESEHSIVKPKIKKLGDDDHSWFSEAESDFSDREESLLSNRRRKSHKSPPRRSPLRKAPSESLNPSREVDLMYGSVSSFMTDCSESGAESSVCSKSQRRRKSSAVKSSTRQNKSPVKRGSLLGFDRCDERNVDFMDDELFTDVDTETENEELDPGQREKKAKAKHRRRRREARAREKYEAPSYAEESESEHGAISERKKSRGKAKTSDRPSTTKHRTAKSRKDTKDQLGDHSDLEASFTSIARKKKSHGSKKGMDCIERGRERSSPADAPGDYTPTKRKSKRYSVTEMGSVLEKVTSKSSPSNRSRSSSRRRVSRQESSRSVSSKKYGSPPDRSRSSSRQSISRQESSRSVSSKKSGSRHKAQSSSPRKARSDNNCLLGKDATEMTDESDLELSKHRTMNNTRKFPMIRSESLMSLTNPTRDKDVSPKKCREKQSKTADNKTKKHDPLALEKDEPASDIERRRKDRKASFQEAGARALLDDPMRDRRKERIQARNHWREKDKCKEPGESELDDSIDRQAAEAKQQQRKQMLDKSRNGPVRALSRQRSQRSQTQTRSQSIRDLEQLLTEESSKEKIRHGSRQRDRGSSNVGAGHDCENISILKNNDSYLPSSLNNSWSSLGDSWRIHSPNSPPSTPKRLNANKVKLMKGTISLPENPNDDSTKPAIKLAKPKREGGSVSPSKSRRK